MTNKKLEEIFWALFLIMAGTLWLLPDAYEFDGLWGIGLGMILLGLNGTRYFYGIKMSGFTLVVGTIALFSGLGDLIEINWNLPLVPLVLIALGIYLVVNELRQPREKRPEEIAAE